MPMNEEVRKADAAIMASCRGMEPDATTYRHYPAIRAELTRLTEIADSVDPLVVRLGEVTTRLEAANALLREIMDYRWFVTRAPFTTEEIQSHLQGAGDE